ncbi:MAG: TMEM175 family protein [Dehalococcoidia bacterium]
MDDERVRRSYERAHDPSRVLALSDGVFAIIITLLVLEIHVPELAGGQTLTDAAREIRPSLVAFLISFVVVAIAWAGHRDLFALIQRTDRILVWLNIVYLLPLCIVPFGASLIARYEEDAVALRMYGFLLLLIAVTRLCIWWYATGRSHLLFHPVDSRSRLDGVAVVAVPGAVYALAIAIAEAAPRASLAIYALAPVLYFIGVIIARTSAPPGSAEQDFT